MGFAEELLRRALEAYRPEDAPPPQGVAEPEPPPPADPRHVRVEYTAPPTLARFGSSNAFVRCVVGPVGSGKSSACVVELLKRAVEQRRGPDGLRRSRWAVIRNTYRQLDDTTRKTFEQWIPAQLGKWHEQSFTFELNFNDVRAEVLFRALDSPEDVKKLLSLELTGAYINELREVPKEILDLLQARVGRYPSEAEGGSTWDGIWADTNAWHVGHWADELFRLNRPEGFELYEQPDGLSPQAENIRHLKRGRDYYVRMCRGKDEEWVDTYVRNKYAASDKGSIYGKLLAALEAAGGLVAFGHPSDGVFTTWDLGISDATAIWFWRIAASGIDFVDHYEASGEPLSHFFRVLAQRARDCGYTYTKHWLPHDARARTLQTGVSLLEQCLKWARGEQIWEAAPVPADALPVEQRGDFAIGPELGLLDGMGAARWLLEQRTRFHPRCEAGVKALKAYRYEWDEVTKSFSKRPKHDWTSHSADAFRYAAVVVVKSEFLTRVKPEPEAPVVPPLARAFTLDMAWELNERMRGRKQRIG